MQNLQGFMSFVIGINLTIIFYLDVSMWSSDDQCGSVYTLYLYRLYTHVYKKLFFLIT